MTVTRRWVVFTAVAVVLVLALGWLLVAKPQKSKVSSLNDQTTSQDQANALLLTQIQSLESEQKELPQQQLRLQSFSTEVPDDVDEPTLLRQLSNVTRSTGVNLVSITPGTAAAVGASSSSTVASPTSASTLYELPVSLSALGSYANAEAFISALERLPRAMLIGSLNVCPVQVSVGSGCSAPQAPGNYVPPPNAVGVTLSAYVFYAPGTDDATSPASGGTQSLTTPATTPATPDVTASSTPGATS